MRSGLTALVLLAFLLGAHLFYTLIIFPEFHTSDEATLQEHVAKLNQLDSTTQRELNWELRKGYMNGVRGSYLAGSSMVVDGFGLVLTACLIVMTYRRARKEYQQSKGR